MQERMKDVSPVIPRLLAISRPRFSAEGIAVSRVQPEELSRETFLETLSFSPWSE